MSRDDNAPSTAKVVGAYAEWDDPTCFRVYLVRDDDSDPEPLRSGLFGAGEHVRLYRAAIAANARDFTQDARERLVGFEKEAQAKRAAVAVKRELKRIEKGEPPIDDHALYMAAQIGQMLGGRRRRP